ncbi:hypothetical protein D9M72_388850 [compost metagenome]
MPLVLTRSATAYGMSVYTPQPATLPAGAADGTYRLQGTDGVVADADLAGATIVRAGASGALAYNLPVAGVMAASGSVSGLYTASGGVLAGTAGTRFELGVMY